VECLECGRLRESFDRIVRQNIALLERFTPTVFLRKDDEIEAIRLGLLDIEARRREARLKLMAHQATHDAAIEAKKSPTQI
jgi:hypothetical protein